MARCTICHTLVAGRDSGGTDDTTSCPECQQEYHRSCWDELGGCGTYGCKAAAVAEKPPPPVLVGAGWGDTKECPSCKQHIGSSLLVCRCGAKFPWADPMTHAEYASWRERENSIRTAKTVLVLLFVGTLLGFTAPVLGPLAGLYAWLKRDRLSGQNGTYLALGYGSAALGASYGIIFLLLAAGV